MLLAGVIAEAQSAFLGSLVIAAGTAAGTSTAAASSQTEDEVLISTQTASASASLEWTGLAAGTSWRLVGRLLVPATNNVGLGLVFGTGAGPTYIPTGYEFGFDTFSSASTRTGFGAENQAVAPLDNGTTANSSPGVSFDVTITTDNANFITVCGTSIFKGQTTHWLAEYVGTVVATPAAITAMKLSFGAGNITSGNASLYSIGA